MAHVPSFGSFEQPWRSPAQETKQMAELQMYINCMMPFGTPSDTSMANVKAIKRTGFPPNLPVPLSVDIKAGSLFIKLLCP